GGIRPVGLRDPAAGGPGLPRAAVRGHRPARLAAAGLGAWRRRGRAGGGPPYPRRGPPPPGGRGPAAVRGLRTGSLPAGCAGSRGVAVLEAVVGQARAAGALVLLDAKRGDIGSTMAAYAAAYLDPAAPLAVDAVTLSPYLGFGALQPALDAAHAHGAGVFVLA